MVIARQTTGRVGGGAYHTIWTRKGKLAVLLAGFQIVRVLLPSIWEVRGDEIAYTESPHRLACIAKKGADGGVYLQKHTVVIRNNDRVRVIPEKEASEIITRIGRRGYNYLPCATACVLPVYTWPFLGLV